MFKKPWGTLVATAVGLVFSLAVVAAEGDKPKEEKKEPKAQTDCPVMGGKIDRKVFVDHEGKRIYLCCPACIETFKKDPAKYLKKLEEAGVTPEASPACAKCGELKGSADCCKEGKETCAQCKLHKGSPGCRKACAPKAEATSDEKR